MKATLPPPVRRKIALGSCLLVVAWLACDFGSDPPSGDDHQHSGAGICAQDDDLHGVLLEDIHTSDTLVTDSEGTVTGRLTMQTSTLLHGVHVLFLDHTLTAFAFAESCSDLSLGWTVADTNVAQVSQDPGLHWYFNVYGKQVGSTTVQLGLLHQQHEHFASAPLPIVVTAVP